MSRLVLVKPPRAAILLVLLVTVTAIACASSGDGLEGRVQQLEAFRVEAAAQLQKAIVELDSLTKAQLMIVLDHIEQADIHNMDPDLQKADHINPLYLDTVRKLGRDVTGAPWPRGPLKDEAKAFAAALAELRRALTNNDLVASREAVIKVHALYHPLLEAGWMVVAGKTID